VGTSNLEYRESVLRNVKGGLGPWGGCHAVRGRPTGRNCSGTESYCRYATNLYDAHVRATSDIKREVAHEEIYRAVRAHSQGGVDGV